MLEVGDRRAFAKEFGVRGDRNVCRRPPRLRISRSVAGADRNGRLGDDDGAGLDHLGELRTACENEAEVGMPVSAARRRSDRDEHRLRALHASPRSVVNASRPRSTLDLTSASRPGSQIGILPASGRRSWPHPCRRSTHDDRSRQGRRRTRGRHSRCRSSQCAFDLPLLMARAALAGDGSWPARPVADRSVEPNAAPASRYFITARRAPAEANSALWAAVRNPTWRCCLACWLVYRSWIEGRLPGQARRENELFRLSFISP